ncbi:MAG: glutaminase [Saprospirales bacterium]|nr:glutaminase [Saprospirales bacterium]MBK8923397.1 glutaminase [Saprospirales bacterium]
MDYQRILDEITREAAALSGVGRVASYIPELAKAPPDRFGMALITLDGQVFTTGDASERFSIQSISKVFLLTLAIRQIGEQLFERVGREPSGNPFNSLVQLEYERGIPRNPFINAGALVVTDVLLAQFSNARQEVLEFARHLSACPDLEYDAAVAGSEQASGFTNAALANYLKSHGNLRHRVETVLEVYFHACSLAMSCVELARAFLFLANHGVLPAMGERLLTVSQTKRLNAILLTCGFYDEAGEFAFRVGLPGKSGVGGGIAAVMPGRWAATVWSPEINCYGNSVRGMKALELLTTLTGESIF